MKINVLCALVIAFSSAFNVGCSSSALDFKKDVLKTTDSMRLGPGQKPRTSDTSFSESLRCMDRLYVTYGIRDISMLIEDLSDQTKKMNVGSKDMFISAVSQMTRRSKAIRLVAYGSATDSTLSTYLSNSAGRPFENIPDYVTRGSISQFDEALVKEQGDAGISISDSGASIAKQATSSVLGLDLNVIRTDDLSLVPGVTARNSVQIDREGFGSDGELILKKFGLNFNFTLTKSEGQAQALRTLIELAAIELFGKLTRVPYWSCLRTSDEDLAVQMEILDWWESFAADPQSLVVYFQNQMRVRGLYNGPIDGLVSPAFLSAIKSYQQVLGLAPDANLNVEFLKRYLAANHDSLQANMKNTPKSSSEAAGGLHTNEQIVPVKKPLSVMLSDPRGPASTYKKGEQYSIEVLLSRDANLYCYLIDEKNQITQFFPNLVAQNPLVKGGAKVQFPGSLPFSFVANTVGAQETIACYASEKYLGLSAIADLSQVESEAKLSQAFGVAAGQNYGTGALYVLPR